MNEQLSTYAGIIQNLIDAVDTMIPLNFDGNVDRSTRFPNWVGSQFILTIFQNHSDEPMQIVLLHGKSRNLLDAEELTIASAYAMVGKFIDLEA